MSFWNTVVGKGISGLGNVVGLGTGATGFQTDPTKFQLPNAAQTQQQVQAGMGNQAATMAGQSQLQNMLMAQSQGGGPNPAIQQLNSATDANNRNAMALAQSTNSGAGGNMAANRSILENQAMNQQGAANQSAQLTAQQQLNSQSQLQQLLGQQQQGALGYMGAGQAANNAQLQGNIAQQQIQAGATENQAQQGGGFIGGIMKGVGGALAAAHGGEVPGRPDGGYAQGFEHGHMLAMLMGGHVPGRAATDGDSGKNDTVPAMLSPGEIVLPRSVTQDDDAAEKAKLFVEAIRKKKY